MPLRDNSEELNVNCINYMKTKKCHNFNKAKMYVRDLLSRVEFYQLPYSKLTHDFLELKKEFNLPIMPGLIWKDILTVKSIIGIGILYGFITPLMVN